MSLVFPDDPAESGIKGDSGGGGLTFPDDTPAAPPTILGEIPRGLKAGVQQLRGFGYGIGALAGEATGIEPVKAWAKAGLADVEAQTPKPAVGSFTDIGKDGNYVSDTAKYLAYGVTTNLPNMLLSFTGGGLGAVLGKGLVGAAAKSAITKAAEKAILEQGIKRGALVGAGLSSIGMEAGSIASDQLTETGKVDPLRAVAGAIPAGLLDVIPEWYLAKRLGWLGKDVAKMEGNRVVRALKVGGQQFAMEAPTEAMQSVIERSAVPGKSISNADAWNEYIDSFVLGGMTGGVMGGVGGVFSKRAEKPPNPVVESVNSSPIELGSQEIIASDPDLQAMAKQIEPPAYLVPPQGEPNIPIAPVSAPEPPLAAPVVNEVTQPAQEAIQTEIAAPESIVPTERRGSPRDSSPAWSGEQRADAKKSYDILSHPPATWTPEEAAYIKDSGGAMGLMKARKEERGAMGLPDINPPSPAEIVGPGATSEGKPIELMSPEDLIAKTSKDLGVDATRPGNSNIGKQALEIQTALNEGRPVNAASFDTLRKSDIPTRDLPKGYVKEGDNYVLKAPSPLPEATPTSIPPIAPITSPEVKGEGIPAAETLQERGERFRKETEAKFAEEAASTETITEREARRKVEKVAEVSPVEARTPVMQKGVQLRDSKTGITYTVDSVVKPRGGETAWIEASDRRNNGIKINPDEIGTRYIQKDANTSPTPRNAEEVKAKIAERPARTDQIGSQTPAPATTPEKVDASIASFTSAMTPMQTAKVKNALLRNLSFDGELLTRKAGIERAVDAGSTIVTSKEGRRLQKPSGAFLAEKDISKTGMDYAEHLIKAKSTTMAAEMGKPAPTFSDTIRESIASTPSGILSTHETTIADNPSTNVSIPKGQRIVIENMLMAEMQQPTGELGGKVTNIGSDNIGEGVFQIDRPYGKLTYNEAMGELSASPAPTTSNMAAQAAKFGVDKTLLLQTLSKDIVNNDLSGTIANETIQNSLDAFMSNQANKQIDVTIDTEYGDVPETVVSVTDNGKGMTASEVKRNLLRLGAKGKTGTTSRGGYGLAKAGFILAPRRSEITTTKQGMQTVLKGTREQFFGVKGAGDPTIETTAVGTSVPNGTTFKLYFYADDSDAQKDNAYALSSYNADWAFDRYINKGVFVDGVQINYRSRYSSTNSNIISKHPSTLPQVYKKAKFDIKGNSLTVYFVPTSIDPQKNWTGKYEVPIKTLNKGLALFGIEKNQYDIDNMWAKPDWQVMVDFDKTTDVRDINYPFLRNRTSMNDEIAKEVSGVVNEKIKSLNEADFNLQKSDFTEMVAKSPIINGIRVLIPFKDQAEFDQASKLISDNAPLVSGLAGVFNSFKVALSKIGGKEIDLTMTVDPKVHGFRSNPEITGHEFYAINPFAVTGALQLNPIFKELTGAGYDTNQAMASNLVHVLVHEYTHNTAKGHSEDFTQAIAVNYMKLTHGVLSRLEQQARRFYEQHGEALNSIQSDLSGMGKGGSRFQTDNINVYPARTDTRRVTDRLGVQDVSAGGAATGATAGGTVTPPPANRPPATPPSTNQSATWESPSSNRKADIFYSMFDKFTDLDASFTEIKNWLSKQGTILTDEQDPLLHVRQYPKIKADQERRFMESEVNPAFENAKKLGVSLGELQTYMHNFIAEHTNTTLAERHIAAIDKENLTRNKPLPYDPLFADGKSGIKTQDAQNYLSSLTPEQIKKYEAAAKPFWDMGKANRQVAIDYQLESPKTMAQWEKDNPFYLPLFRDMGKESNVYEGVGQGFTNVGGISKERVGSERVVVDPIANLIMQRAKIISRGEKNKTDIAVANLVKMAPNPDWWKPATVRIRGFLSTNGVMTKGIDPTYKYESNVIMSRQFDTKTGDIIERGVEFNKDTPRAERLANALKNADMDKLGLILDASAKITRFISKANTEYSPTFGPTNFLRDWGFMLANLSTTPLKGKQMEVSKKMPSALSMVYSEMRARRSGEHSTHSLSKAFDDFQRYGGMQGYSDMFRSSDQMSKNIERELRLDANNNHPVLRRGMKGAETIVHWLSDFNKALENATRFSVYQAGIENGMSGPRAANMANEITVDFSKKGQIATHAGALFAFFNASAQGSLNVYKVLTGPSSGKIIMGGIIFGAAQAALLSASGFGDGEPPDFIKERNIIIPTGGKSYKTIPLPLGLNILPNIGRILAEATMAGLNGKPIKPMSKIANMISIFADSFNPLGGSGLSIQTITPTPIDPLVALAENMDWNRQQISRPNYSSLNPTPGFRRSRDTTSYSGKGLSWALNMLTGGTEDSPGFFSPTADQIDYLAGQFTGGVGRELTKGQHIVSALSKGEEIPAYRIPLISRFHGSTEGQAQESTRFYDNIKTMNMHEREIKGRRDRRESVAEYIKDNPEARFYAMANRAESSIKRLQVQKRTLTERDASSESIKTINAIIGNKMKQFNQTVKRMGG